MKVENSLAPHLPAPSLQFDGGDRVYIVYGGRVWSGLFTSASYELAPACYQDRKHYIARMPPQWDARMLVCDIRDDKLPEPPPVPKPLPWWRRAWQRLVDIYRSQTLE